MRQNLCDNLDSLNINISFNCSDFISGTTKEGLHPVLINFIETIRQILFEVKSNTQNIIGEEKVWNLGMQII